MVLIAGLGNPGLKYEGTRHNTGYMAVDEVAVRSSIHFTAERFRAVFGSGTVGGKRSVLLKPVTFMNLSGKSIREAVSFYHADPAKDLIVVYDDIDLDVGRIRIRKNGSAGGHNGMKSIIRELGTEDFIRIRIGIGGKPEKWDLADWVLSRFTPEEADAMGKASQRAAEAAESILTEGIDKAMTLYNRREDT
ncbi:MAG: aminoacyl-tRNA hydrolase [Lachnospiraceae bacterium]|nr:aminoacyl-tRNA hydrolase [Lachnospiraceae bacterium]